MYLERSRRQVEVVQHLEEADVEGAAVARLGLQVAAEVPQQREPLERVHRRGAPLRADAHAVAERPAEGKL